LKVSLIQCNSIDDKAANLRSVAALVEQAVRRDAPDWILLPEHFEWMGPSSQRVAIAEPSSGGPAYEAMRALARTHGVWLHAGSFYERAPEEGRVFNTTVVFNRSGEEVARYRKIHLFDVTLADGTRYFESEVVLPGDRIVLYDCEGVTIGCSICYDLRFPELFQALAARGAQVIALPAAFTLQTGKDHWEPLIRARAIETGTWFLAAGQCGANGPPEARRFSYGHSLVADPWGHIVAKASDGAGVVSAHVDLGLLERVRAQIPVAQHKVIGKRICV
jgi:predicted amidohydrolase